MEAVCEEPNCSDDCEGYKGNWQLCTVGCEGTKTLSCPNVTFGCYEANDQCEDVGNCVNDLI